MIYIVEDDINIRELVTYTMNKSGLPAEGFARPSDFWRRIKIEKPELIMLDIMLPEEDGLGILRKLRSDKVFDDVPIMMLTAKGSEYDKVVGLDSGADDYLPKPFGMMELIARVKALLRRSKNREENFENDELIAVGNIRIDCQRHEAKIGEKTVELTLKEFNVLYLLASNKGKVFSREELLNKIWGYDFSGENRTVDVHIRTLRKKLGKSGDIIETVKGVGYKVRG